uniref:Growth hormone receptor n=1 Tax=Romanomermis culicivorax TaxID=13658 RepID=A0A915IC51_ROMCU
NQVSPISRFVTPPPTADVLDVVLQLSEKPDRPDITQKFEVQVNNDCEEPFARPHLIVLEKNISSSLCNKNISLDTPTLLPASVSTVAQSDHVYDSSIPGQLSFLPN